MKHSEFKSYIWKNFLTEKVVEILRVGYEITWRYFLFYFYFFYFFKKILYFIYLFSAVLGLHFCARAFSSCGKREPLFIAVRGPLTIAASLVAEHRLQTHRLSSCGSRA